MTDDILDEKAFDEFREMAFVPAKDPRVMVYCEECNDSTIIEKGGSTCGHRTKWQDDLDAWLAKREAT